jgi:hypothetical protein
VKRRSFAQTMYLCLQVERRLSFTALALALESGDGIDQAQARHAKVSVSYRAARDAASADSHAPGGLWS